MMPLTVPPRGLDGLRAICGPIVVDAGAIVAPPGWESANMVMLDDLPGLRHRLYLNRRIEAPLRLALEQCLELGDAYEVLTIGCFAPRAKRTNPLAYSVHSWGMAVDINADTNRLAAAAGDPCVTDIPEAWVTVWERVGWTWGGRWHRPDPMHFQFCSNY